MQARPTSSWRQLTPQSCSNRSRRRRSSRRSWRSSSSSRRAGASCSGCRVSGRCCRRRVTTSRPSCAHRAPRRSTGSRTCAPGTRPSWPSVPPRPSPCGCARPRRLRRSMRSDIVRRRCGPSSAAAPSRSWAGRWQRRRGCRPSYVPSCAPRARRWPPPRAARRGKRRRASRRSALALTFTYALALALPLAFTPPSPSPFPSPSPSPLPSH